MKKIISIVISSVMAIGMSIGMTGCGDNENLQKQIEELKASVERLKNENITLSDKVGTLETSNQELENEIGKLETSNQELESEIGTLETENTELKNVIEKLETQEPSGRKEESIVGDFRITVSTDKTEIKTGETITVTVTLENIGTKDILFEIPDFIAYRDKKDKKDVLLVRVCPDAPEYDAWWFVAVAVGKRPKIVMEKNTVIENTFEYKMEEAGDFKIHAGAFLYLPDETNGTSNISEMRILVDPIKIIVRG